MTTGMGGSLLYGPEGLARLGQQVAALGDVNGDGYEDFAVTALRAGNGYDIAGQDNVDQVGIVYLVYGRNSDLAAVMDFNFTGGLQPDGVNFTVLQGYQAAGQFGSQMSYAGDLNGDGLNDILVGSARMEANAGLVHVIYGQTGGLGAVLDIGEMTADQGAVFSATTGNFGNVVSDLGDVNGDGHDDFIAYTTSDNTGWLVFGDGRNFPAVTDLETQFAGRLLRLDNAFMSPGGGVGDLNHDGLADFVTKGNDVTVQFGSSDLAAGVLNLDTQVMTGSNGFAMTAPSTIFGAWRLDDINGDLIDDMLVTGFGDAWVVYGRSTGFAATLDLATLDAATGIRLTGAGFALDYGGVGDANGDGLRDFIMGNSTGNGTGYLVFGQAEGRTGPLDLNAMTPDQGYRVTGLTTFDAASGGQLADVNGDGFSDWLLSITGLDLPSRFEVGGMAVIYGGPSRLAALDAADGAVDGVLSLDHLDDVLTFTEPDPVPLPPEPLGSGGNDNLTGSAGPDVIDLLAGNDRYAGGGGDDIVQGGAGRDILSGEAGNDDLRGGLGNDRLQGGLGRDSLEGNAGDDQLTGGLGADRLTGGASADRFIFAGGCGRDVIRDFDVAADRLALDASLWVGVKSEAQVLADHAQVVGGTLVLDFGGGDVVRLTGLTAANQLVGLIDIL